MKYIIGVVVLAFTLTAFSNENFKIKSDSGKVTFVAKGKPALLKIKGEGQGVEGTLNLENQKISGDVVFSLTSLKTGISLRDNHMKNKYLEVQKYPQAKLSLKDLKVPDNFKGKMNFMGDLTLHGVTKKVKGKAKLLNKKTGSDLGVEAEFKIDLSEYGIGIPSFQGITVAKEVVIKVKTGASREGTTLVQK